MSLVLNVIVEGASFISIGILLFHIFVPATLNDESILLLGNDKFVRVLKVYFVETVGGKILINVYIQVDEFYVTSK